MNKYRRIKYEDRCQIYALSKRGSSQESIAEVLGVSQSAVSWEMQRNRGRQWSVANSRSKQYRPARSATKNRRQVRRCRSCRVS